MSHFYDDLADKAEALRELAANSDTEAEYHQLLAQAAEIQDTPTRNELFSQEIDKLSARIEEMRRRAAELAGHAHSEDAQGHEALYSHAEQELINARDAIDEAYEIIANGDPEDY